MLYGKPKVDTHYRKIFAEYKLSRVTNVTVDDSAILHKSKTRDNSGQLDNKSRALKSNLI